MKRLIMLAGLLACASAASPPTDKKVVSRYIGTKQESKSFTAFGGNGTTFGSITTTVPAFYFISSDNMECEVAPRTYSQFPDGKLYSCVWEESK